MTSQLDPISVVTAADDNYAMPLAATVASLLNSLKKDERLDLYVIDGGISADSHYRLWRGWNDSRLNVHWLEPDLSLLDGMDVSGHVSQMTYARLLLPLLLPEHLERVIYLDSDLLVLRPIGELWSEPVEGVGCRACQDPAAPWIDSERVLANYDRCGPRLAGIRPVPNYRQFGMHPSEPYFNAGVMLVNLQYWRDNAITRKAITCLHANREHMLWWDQYALNVILYRRWRPLDMRWNQGAQIYRYPTYLDSPLDRETFRQLRRQPWIVHFSSHRKPWHSGYRHPYRRRFFQMVDRTQWRGWRPANDYPTIPQRIGNAYRSYRVWYRQRISPVEHKVKAALGLKKRAA